MAATKAKNTRSPRVKTQPAVDAMRVRMALMGRINAIAGLTPEILASHLQAFDLGYLRQAALVWQKIRDRDDQVKTVTGKREMAASLLDWEILGVDESPEALQHKDKLKAFYNNLTATDALDKNKRGGVSTLIAQMLDAVGKKYAVHEIVWDASGADLTATFHFTPLWFFNNTTGSLRYLRSEGDTVGIELEDGGWMVTVGAGLMEATSIAYLFKRMPLTSWLAFCEKFSIPGLHGKTDARKGSEEWNAMHDALANFSSDWAILTNMAASITPIEVKTSGSLPHPELVDRMDRAIARLWRGGDLSTMSKDGAAVGSQPQDDEAHKLEVFDAMLVSETLHHYVDKHVIQYCFGAGVQPKAYFKLKPTMRVDTRLELDVDRQLIEWGVPRGIKDLLERYGRPEIAEDDTPAKTPAPPPQFGAARPAPDADPAQPLANSGFFTEDELRAQGRERLFKAAARMRLAESRRAALAPIIDRLLEIGHMVDPDAQRIALGQFQRDLPSLQAEVLARAPALAGEFEAIIGTALVDGASGSGGTGRLPVGLSNMAPRHGDTEWNESDYVRDEEDRFAPKGGGASGASDSKMEGKARERVVRAIKEAHRRKGEVHGAIEISGLGKVSIGLGTSGDKDNDFKGGWGAAHWQGKHAESSSGAVADLLTKGKIGPHRDFKTGAITPDKREITHGSWFGVIAKKSKGKWRLVTVYDKK